MTPAEQLLIDICKIVLPKDDELEEDVDRMFQLHFLKLSDDDKRKWFATCVRESSLRKTAEERVREAERLGGQALIAMSAEVDLRKAAESCLAILTEAAGRLAEAMHASAPAGYKCSDCAINNEPCPICYQAWWQKQHPNTRQI